MLISVLFDTSKPEDMQLLQTVLQRNNVTISMPIRATQKAAAKAKKVKAVVTATYSDILAKMNDSSFQRLQSWSQLPNVWTSVNDLVQLLGADPIQVNSLNMTLHRLTKHYGLRLVEKHQLASGKRMLRLSPDFYSFLNKKASQEKPATPEAEEQLRYEAEPF